MSKESTYLMKDYGKQSTFASFLPGIAGVKGVPIWCYYVNRGQGVVSFGVDNKDHAIMEFYPAHVSYQNVKTTGFRTFIRNNGAFLEAFSDENNAQEMEIAMNQLTIREELAECGLKVEVNYFTLPEEQVGALVRKVTVTNTASAKASLEILDGMPAVIPYGVGQDSMKNMTQTAKAWMQVEDTKEGRPFYRVRASMADSASVTMVEGGNFGYGVADDGTRLSVVTDPELVFAYDSALAKPVSFMEKGLLIVNEDGITSNLLPSCFFAVEKELNPGESLSFYEMIGQVESKDILDDFLKKNLNVDFFENKKARALSLVEEVVAGIATETGDEKFDAYCKYTYMDNVLRGGYPMQLGHNKIFYVYSRKHGDLERDYNYFSMLPEFFSQGNGNFRDVNQNRRLDSFFAPFVGRENIHTFYSLIQLDGYNPLGVEKLTYIVDEDNCKVILKGVDEACFTRIYAIASQPFTPGKLYAALLKEVKLGTIKEDKVESVFTSLIDFAEATVNGNFGEGYWSDHWDYNLDLIEEYLSVFPEKEREMLEEKAYTYFLSQVLVNPRFKRYEVTANGLRQYHALNEASHRNTEEKLVRANYGKGEVIKTTLIEKLLLLCACKFATLDAYGMGVEMEGGKPGWYDALNGMPGMLGSSMAETYEVARMLDYVIGALERNPGSVSLMKELGNFLEELELIVHLEEENLATKKQVISFWNRINDAKELYREKTFAGVSGETKEYNSDKLRDILADFRMVVGYGIDKAVEYGNGICPTYFTYDVTEYDENKDGIIPKNFEVQMVPYFLEGPVRYLKLDESLETKKALYNEVKASDLYDQKLSMYKVNASLLEASYELGRARAFTPGWLENESIWLHMEYKYLLELIKSGLYEEYAEDFHKALIPFLDEKVYGRSILENSSFIASSKNPNEKIHGKGFVARLSGSTIEFINMWKLMMFGKNPFTLEDGELTLRFCPVIPEYLVGEDKKVSAMFLGKTKVTYAFAEKKNYFPGSYQIKKMELIYGDKRHVEVNGDKLSGNFAKDVRDGGVKEIKIFVA